MLTYQSSVDEMMLRLKSETINTWFDLGIFIDKFRETRPLPSVNFHGSYSKWCEELSNSGMAFVTFMYSIDGVTIEIEKYTNVFQKLFSEISIHYIGGKFFTEADKIIPENIERFEVSEMACFNDWPLYNSFFLTKLERGSEAYNNLILDFWKEVLIITEKLGRYIEQNNIKLLYLVNVCSNPGNVSLALATVLVSEIMGIPVINNNHDFYWEGGNRPIDIETQGLKKGPRDFFFTNSHLGEVFSLIEVLFPWESRSWMNTNINRNQSSYLINENGHNPANVTEIGTAVDTLEYLNISKRQKINAYYQFEKILSRYQDTLIGYSVNDIIKNGLVDENNHRPILIGSKTHKIEKFLSENIILLQPTRIIGRKRIEQSFRLIKKMFSTPDFAERLRKTPNLKLTIIVTGPIANGHFKYFTQLLKSFSKLLNSFDSDLATKLYLSFLFSELDKKPFKLRFEEPVTIPDLYNIASLILLPSKTEGRGLPIIEASACGTPIFCRRYNPENVYSEVIGEHLPENQRLKVIEFSGKKITTRHARRIINRVLFPHLYTSEVIHNKTAVKQRFSINALTNNIEQICKKLFFQIKPNDTLFNKTETLLEWYENMVSFKNDDLAVILNTSNRQYMPGFGSLMFMNHLKSLIDPSAFRREEQNNRGFIHGFSRYLVNTYCMVKHLEMASVVEFYNAVDNIFHIKKGELEIRHDHSFSYRHRNKNYYPFQDYTLQELTGLVNILFQEFVNPRIDKEIDESSHFYTDFDLALAQLTSSSFLAIDDRKCLIKNMQTNVSFGLFPGEHIKYELEFFVLQAIRSRLKLSLENTLTQEMLLNTQEKLKTVYIFANERSIGKWFNKQEITEYLISGSEPELKLLYENEFIKVVNSRQVSVGIHFPQMGEKALSALRIICEDGGYIVANRPHATVMTDIVNINRFHIGKAKHPLIANFLGIPKDSGYIQFVPAGIRTTLAYPTPIQTAKSFNDVIKSELFNSLSKQYGEDHLWNIIRKESEENEAPLQYILEKISGKQKDGSKVEYKYVNGIYSDNFPWNGVYAKVHTANKKLKWQFRTLIAKGKTKRVTSFVDEFKKETNNTALIAWNGGYILNPELVGKLGLPESYIGSPLGLIISNGKILCPPLFNKAALLISSGGGISIRKVSVVKGIRISFGEKVFDLNEGNYNQSNPEDQVCYYDLQHSNDSIPSKGRYIIRLAGNVVKEIIMPGKNKKEKIIPVGLTLSFPAEQFPADIKPGDELEMQIPELADIKHAIEAGPHLIEEGKVVINMEKEGWTHRNSIRTQAARLDYTDMRGPKIAVGIDTDGNLFVLTINGRIRESVGTTHFDMANIMKQLGMVSAMGFDPGGSSTLVVNGQTMNISPYNSDYEKNIYALPPEPRAVSNAVVGYIEE
jgi:exopolysaccharide biosynthesis protein/glycosyltransferase involved in cell wall biosynthesis